MCDTLVPQHGSKGKAWTRGIIHDVFILNLRRRPRSTLFPYTTLFRSRLRRPSGNPQVLEHRERAQRRPQPRSEEHTSELQSPDHLVCRLLLEKKNEQANIAPPVFANRRTVQTRPIPLRTPRKKHHGGT